MEQQFKNSKIERSRNEFNLQINTLAEKLGIDPLIVLQEYGNLEKKLRTSFPLRGGYYEKSDNIHEFILESIKEKLKLEKISVIDGLTGIYNRRYLDGILIPRINEAHAKRTELREEEPEHGVLIFDIDFFKKVNDTYGHPSGDLVLKQFAAIISHNIRVADGDSPIRYGGEEFMAVVLKKNGELTVVAERILRAVEKHGFVIGENDRTINITTSIGVSNWLTDGKETMAKVDQALYLAKEKGGRNTFFVYNKNLDEDGEYRWGFVPRNIWIKKHAELFTN